jgi:hypothetical protein
MSNIDHRLRMPKFHGMGSEDPEKHLFVCDTIWTTKNVQDKAMKIVQLAMKFMGRALLCYMKFKISTLPKLSITLEKFRQALLKEFRKMKF